jgi:hypothetical protein
MMNQFKSSMLRSLIVSNNIFRKFIIFFETVEKLIASIGFATLKEDDYSESIVPRLDQALFRYF